MTEKYILTRPAIRSSNIRTGLPRRGSPNPRMINTSKAVNSTPCQSSSFGKSIHRAMADPSNSARSVAMIATSDKTYRGYRPSQRYKRVCFGRLCSSRRQCEARSRVTNNKRCARNKQAKKIKIGGEVAIRADRLDDLYSPAWPLLFNGYRALTEHKRHCYPKARAN